MTTAAFVRCSESGCTAIVRESDYADHLARRHEKRIEPWRNAALWHHLQALIKGRPRDRRLKYGGLPPEFKTLRLIAGFLAKYPDDAWFTTADDFNPRSSLHHLRDLFERAAAAYRLAESQKGTT